MVEGVSSARIDRTEEFTQLLSVQRENKERQGRGRVFRAAITEKGVTSVMMSLPSSALHYVCWRFGKN